jgi:hypothetical protein
VAIICEFADNAKISLFSCDEMNEEDVVPLSRRSLSAKQIHMRVKFFFAFFFDETGLFGISSGAVSGNWEVHENGDVLLMFMRFHITSQVFATDDEWQISTVSLRMNCDIASHRQSSRILFRGKQLFELYLFDVHLTFLRKSGRNWD